MAALSGRFYGGYMAGQGLQAWDENGVLMLDVGDYSTRFVGNYSIRLNSGAASASVAAPGVTKDKHFAAVTSGSETSVLMTEMTAIAGDGVVYLVALTGSVSYARTANVDVYAFS